MTTEEHLQRIRARCTELLAIAEKRTPGRWRASKGAWTGMWSVSGVDTVCDLSYEDDHASIEYPNDGANATFIASCAGPAEAGWKATIAAINDIVVRKQFDGGAFPTCAVTSGILAAWPEELL